MLQLIILFIILVKRITLLRHPINTKTHIKSFKTSTAPYIESETKKKIFEKPTPTPLQGTLSNPIAANRSIKSSFLTSAYINSTAYPLYIRTK